MDFYTIWNFVRNIYDKFLISLFIILLGFIAGKATGRIVEHLLKGVDINRLLKKAGSDIAFDKAFAQLSSYAIYIITIIIVLQVLGIRHLVFVILLIIMAVILAISLFTTITLVLPNVFFGFFVKKKLKKGDLIIINSIKGKIKKLRFADVIVTSKKDIFSIPYTYIKKRLRQ